MSDTHNKLQYGNNYNHWKILGSVLDLNRFSFSNPNPTHLPKHQTLSLNHQFSQRIWYVKYYSVYAHMAWSQKFRKSAISLNIGPEPCTAQIWTHLTQIDDSYVTIGFAICTAFETSGSRTINGLSGFRQIHSRRIESLRKQALVANGASLSNTLATAMEQIDVLLF